MIRPARLVPAVLLAAAALAAPAMAAPGDPPVSTEKTATDAATQPLEDINLKKEAVPPELERILDNPYSLDGIKRCREIVAAVAELNTVLGADLDVDVPEDRGKKRRDTVLRLSGNFLSNLVLPFRGVVREISGSAGNDRRYRAAIVTGVARRSFLKGVGAAKGCKPPGAPEIYVAAAAN